MIDISISGGRDIDRSKDSLELVNIPKVFMIGEILITQTILREVSHHVVHHVARVDHHNKGAGTDRLATNQGEAVFQETNPGVLIQVMVGMGVGGGGRIICI